MVSINDDPFPLNQEEEQDDPNEPRKTISLSSAYAYAVNYVLGVGILGIPYAIVQGGLLLSTGVLIIVAILSLMSALWLIEVTARANGLANLANRDLDSTELDPLVKKYNNPFKLGTKRYEIADLCRIFIGPWARYFYALISFVYIFTLMWSYGNVFGTSLTSLIPFPGVSMGQTCDFYSGKFGAPCINAYYIYMAFFFVAVIPLCLLDIADQLVIQIILCFFRFVAVTMMFATAVGGLYSNPYDPENDNDPPYIAYSSLFKIENFAALFPIAVFSQLMHFGVPGIIHPIERKSRVRRVFVLSTSSTVFLYIFTGISCALYFGDKTRAPITLNWKEPAGFPPSEAPLWARVLSYFIFLFPVVDMISAFPLSAVALGDMFYSLLPSKWRLPHLRTRSKVFSRLMAAVPPLVVSTFARSLVCSPLFGFLNTAGFFVAFITPAVLQIRSKQVCSQKFGQRLGASTPYSWHGSHNVYAGIVLIFGIAAFGYTNAENILQLINGQVTSVICQ